MKPIYRLLLSAIVAVCVAAPAAQAQTVIEEWNTAKFPAAAAEAGEDRRQGDRAAGDGFHRADLHRSAPPALRGIGAEGAEIRQRSAGQGRADHLQRRGAEVGAGRHPPGADTGRAANRCCRRSDPTSSSTAIWRRRSRTAHHHRGGDRHAGADLGAAHGATAALKGFEVIVPVDGMSAATCSGALHDVASRPPPRASARRSR